MRSRLIKSITDRLITLPFKISNGNIPTSYFAGKSCVFSLHKVVKNKEELDPYNNYIEITKDHLEQILKYLIGKRYYFASINELNYFIEHDSFPKQKVIHFSFDDGYLDNLTIANPIFEHYKIPYSIFITTGLPERDTLVWWYLLSELFDTNKRINLPEFNFKFDLTPCSDRQKLILFDELANLIKFNSFKEFEYFKFFFLNHGVDPLNYLEKSTMSWDNIKQLHTTGLATIGVHSHNHFPLKLLTNSEMEQEILYSKKLLETKLDESMKFYCYPFGSSVEVGRREIDFVMGSGFSMAFGTKTGNIFSKDFNNIFYLPRIFLNDQVNKYALNMRLNGLYPFLSNNYSRFFNL